MQVYATDMRNIYLESIAKILYPLSVNFK